MVGKSPGRGAQGHGCTHSKSRLRMRERPMGYVFMTIRLKNPMICKDIRRATGRMPQRGRGAACSPPVPDPHSGPQACSSGAGSAAAG